MNNQPMRWVIWSEEHGQWWAPGECGYTDQLAEAGRYSQERAVQIMRRANIAQTPPDFCEIAMPDPLPLFQVMRARKAAEDSYFDDDRIG